MSYLPKKELAKKKCLVTPNVRSTNIFSDLKESLGIGEVISSSFQVARFGPDLGTGTNILGNDVTNGQSKKVRLQQSDGQTHSSIQE